MLFFILFAVTAATAIYFYYRRALEYWPRKGIKIPPAEFFFGHIRMVFKLHDPRVLKFRDFAKMLGTKTYGLNEGARRCLVSSDVNILQEVFVKQFDNFYSRRVNPIGPNPDTDERVNLFQSRGVRWKRLRAISAPSFSVNSLKKIRPVVEDSVKNMLSIMEGRHANGEAFNIHEFYMEYTMDTIGRLVMGQKESHYFRNPRVAVAKSLFMRDLSSPFLYANLAFPFLNKPSYFFLQNVRNKLMEPQEELFREMGAAVKERIKRREELPESANDAAEDFIDLFLDTAAEDIHHEKSSDFKLAEQHVEKNLTIPEVISQAVIFLLAGFDTTANALGYTSWLLSKHPEVLKKCQEEIDEVCSEENISYEDLSNLRYLEATCKEALRFYPLGTFASARTCMKTTTVCGIEIEEGTAFQADVFSLHFDKEVWGEDADEFKPERWLDPTRRVPPIAYLPFGGGPRICIGMRLAMMEEKLALAHILRKFDIVKGTEATELELMGSLTLTPVSVPVKIVSRT